MISIYHVPLLSVHSHSTNRLEVIITCRTQGDLTKGLTNHEVRGPAKPA